MSLRHAAAIIIREHKVLLIKRSEAEDSEPNKWCLPNETLKEGELPEDGVVRGVREELGLSFTVQQQLSNHTYDGHTTFLFVGTAAGEIVPAPEEVSDFDWFSYSEANRLSFAYNYDGVVERLYALGLVKE